MKKLIILLFALSACSTVRHGYEFRIRTDTYKEKSILSYDAAVQRIKNLPLKDTVLTKNYFYYEDEEYTIYMQKK